MISLIWFGSRRDKVAAIYMLTPEPASKLTKLSRQGVKLFCRLASLEWESPRVRQWPVQASTPLLPHGEHQAPPIWKVGSVCIHFSTEVLQIPAHSSMIERGDVEPHLSFRRGDPPAQLEERYQAFPPTGLITFPKVVISDPHAQIGESDLQQRHDLIFGVIQFLHFAFACSKLFLLAQDESQDSTGLFTVVQFAFSC